MNTDLVAEAPRFFTARETAQQLGLTRSGISHAVEEGRLKPIAWKIKGKNRKCPLFSADQIAAFQANKLYSKPFQRHIVTARLNGLMTSREAAAYKGVDVTSVHTAAREGRLRTARLLRHQKGPNPGTYLFDRDDLDAWTPKSYTRHTHDA
jgi:transcriptional regulator with AAA-type ATPase domain